VVPSSLTFRDCIATAVYAAFLRAGGWGGEITRCQITGKQILESLTSVVGTPAIQGCLLVQTATSTGFIGVPASPFVIRGNTLIGGGWSIGVNVGCNPNAGVAVHGNIITGFNVGITAPVAGIPACQYGDCWGNVTANYAGHASAGVGSISVNPLFIGSGNYRLQTGSPCYDTGGSIMSGQTDIDGHARPQGMACDMGAFETEVPTITYTADAYRGAPTDAYACDLTGAPLDGYGPLDLYPASPVVTLARLVLTSLLSDREALASDRIPDGTTDRRGWWADSYNDDKRKTGSRLWLLASSPIRDDTAKQAKSYAEEALAWMVKDGIAAAVTVEAELQGSSQERRVAVGVTVTKDDGTGVRLQFPELWTIYGG
jgi:phage gp46-like protein